MHHTTSLSTAILCFAAKLLRLALAGWLLSQPEGLAVSQPVYVLQTSTVSLTHFVHVPTKQGITTTVMMMLMMTSVSSLMMMCLASSSCFVGLELSCLDKHYTSQLQHICSKLFNCSVHLCVHSTQKKQWKVARNTTDTEHNILYWVIILQPAQCRSYTTTFSTIPSSTRWETMAPMITIYIFQLLFVIRPQKS